jgi:predicted transposase YdaD
MKKLVIYSIVTVCACSGFSQNKIQKILGATTKEERAAYKEAKTDEKAAKKALEGASKKREEACNNSSPMQGLFDVGRKVAGVESTCDTMKKQENLERNNLAQKQKETEQKKKEYNAAKKREGAIR